MRRSFSTVAATFFAMWLAHAAMPNDRWFLDLLVSAAAGAAVYVGTFLAFGLSPTERAAAIRELALY